MWPEGRWEGRGCRCKGRPTGLVGQGGRWEPWEGCEQGVGELTEVLTGSLWEVAAGRGE